MLFKKSPPRTKITRILRRAKWLREEIEDLTESIDAWTRIKEGPLCDSEECEEAVGTLIRCFTEKRLKHSTELTTREFVLD